MREIEQYLKGGTIAMCSMGLLFKADFVFNGEIICREQSDKGLNHLFALLAARIANNPDIKKQADVLYPYSMSVVADCNKEIEYKLTNRLVEIACMADGFVTVIREPYIPGAQSIIGLYCRNSQIEETIMASLHAAIAARYIPLEQFIPLNLLL